MKVEVQQTLCLGSDKELNETIILALKFDKAKKASEQLRDLHDVSAVTELERVQ